MSDNRWVKKTSNKDLLSDLRAYRRGTNYNKPMMLAFSAEVKRRKKLGLIRKNANASTKRNNINRGFVFKVPKFY